MLPFVVKNRTEIDFCKKKKNYRKIIITILFNLLWNIYFRTLSNMSKKSKVQQVLPCVNELAAINVKLFII